MMETNYRKKHDLPDGVQYDKGKYKRYAPPMRSLLKHLPSSLHKILALVVVTIVALAGSYFIFLSNAATPFAAVEPEVGTLKAPAVKVPDTSASGGNAIKFPGSAGGFVTVMDQQFTDSATVAYSSTKVCPYPDVSPEWSGVEPIVVSNGTAKITGNTATSTDKGFHRFFSCKRYGGPNTSIRISTKVRMTKLYDHGTWGGVPGVKLGMKFPSSGTGYSEDDPRSVRGGTGGAAGCTTCPAAFIFVYGTGPDGYMELARKGYGTQSYLTPWAYNKKVGYTLNTWKDIVVQVDWLGSDTVRVRYWHNAAGTGTPIYDWQGYAPFNEPGFLWYRTDFSDFEYDFVKVEQKKL